VNPGAPSRILREESGVALALAVMLVVVIGVMGAGLLIVVVTSLQATVEANRGQRAFEMAEAGVEVAGARLAEEPGLETYSSGELSLEGVDGGSVLVTIERRGEEGARFKATSTGEYAGTRRRIEATFTVAGERPVLLGWRELYE
jgi:Tfp pilus assembly protein PilX